MSASKNPADVWNERFSTEDYIFGKLPNHYLLQQFQRLHKGKTLAIADGEGRNSVWLASQGLTVDAFDIASNAINKAKKFASLQDVSVNFQCCDWSAFDWKTSYYDNILGIFFQFAAPGERSKIFSLINKSLKPGGMLLLHGYSPAQLAYKTGGPNQLENLYTESLLLSSFPNYHVLDLCTYEREIHEGDAHKGLSGLIGYIAQKPLNS